MGQLWFQCRRELHPCSCFTLEFLLSHLLNQLSCDAMTLRLGLATEEGTWGHQTQGGDHGESSVPPQASHPSKHGNKMKLHVYALLEETKEVVTH